MPHKLRWSSPLNYPFRFYKLLASRVEISIAFGDSYDYSSDWAGAGVDSQGNVIEQTPGGDFVAPPETDVTPLEPPSE